jgi:putative tryptophan/tyrosine transport system substrate-binding protein
MWCSTMGVIVTLTLSILTTPMAADAQPAEKVHRIGRLAPGSTLPESNPSGDKDLEAFRQGLREFGYVEGQNIVIEYRYAEGRDDRLADLAAELVRLKVDVIVAIGGVAATRAVQHATRTIPIVMAGASDPVREGLVASLTYPGGNITGLSNLSAELPGKRLEILKETVPQSARVAVLANPANPNHASAMHTLTGAAQALGLHLHVVELRSPNELDAAFAAMTRAGPDALFVQGEPLLLDGLRGRIVDRAATSRLPAMYSWRMYVEAGGLMAYGPSLPDMHRRAAAYVAKILKGAKPADLPVEQPTKFEFGINLKTAQALGLTIPPAVLFLADEVLQ